MKDKKIEIIRFKAPFTGAIAVLSLSYKIKFFLGLFLFLSWVICLVLGSGGEAVCSDEIHPYFESSKHGRINWYSGQVQARGTSNSTILWQEEQSVQEVVFREARIRARGHLLKTLLEIRLNSSKKVHHILGNEKRLSSGIRSILHLARVSGKQKVSEQEMAVTLTTNIYKFSRHILPDSFWYEAKDNKDSRFSPSLKIEDLPLDLFSFQPVPVYTGLIVDAKRTSGHPALICKIFDQSDRLIYGPSKVIPQVARERGMAKYVEDLESAKICQLTGDKPLIVQAQEVRGANGCDYVIASDQLDLFLKSNPKTEIFKQCRVVIVLGPSDPSELTEYTLE